MLEPVLRCQTAAPPGLWHGRVDLVTWLLPASLLALWVCSQQTDVSAVGAMPKKEPGNDGSSMVRAVPTACADCLPASVQSANTAVPDRNQILHGEPSWRCQILEHCCLHGMEPLRCTGGKWLVSGVLAQGEAAFQQAGAACRQQSRPDAVPAPGCGGARRPAGGGPARAAGPARGG